MTTSRSTIACVVAIVCCVLAIVAAEGDGAVALTALSWVAAAIAAIAVALLP